MQGSHVQMLGLGVALMFKLWRWVSARNVGEITHITSGRKGMLPMWEFLEPSSSFLLAVKEITLS